MMDQIINVVSNVGFPIAMCIIMIYYYHTAVEEMKESINTLNDTISTLNVKIDALISGRRAGDDKGD